jgi:hypothetical protein
MGPWRWLMDGDISPGGDNDVAVNGEAPYHFG